MAEKSFQDILRQEWDRRKRSGNLTECFDTLVGDLYKSKPQLP